MWILFASLNPFAEGFRSLFIKKTSQFVEPIIISWFNYVIPLTLFLPLLFFIQLKFNTSFFIGVCGSASINVLAVILYMKAISEGDISIVMPIMSFTPLFLLVTSPIMIGEFPNIHGLVGILLVVIGSYLLNISKRSRGIFYPFKSLFENKSTRYMFIVSFIWSISANFDKISIQSSSLPQHLVFVNLLIFSLLTVILGFKRKLKKENIKPGGKNLIFVSFFTACAFIFHMTALSLTLVAYVVAMKRMSGIISVFLGHFILKEPDIKQRLLGSAVMFAGVLFIVTS